MIYDWNSGRSRRLSAQYVGETVEALAQRNGGVCPPAALVDEARPPKSPLHPIIFRLDTDQAAESWYQQEARQLINDIVIVVEDSPVRPAAFISVKVIDAEGGHQGYAPREFVLSTPDLREQALEEALRSLNGWRRRYRHLKELAPVFEAIDEIEAKV